MNVSKGESPWILFLMGGIALLLGITFTAAGLLQWGDNSAPPGSNPLEMAGVGVGCLALGLGLVIWGMRRRRVERALLDSPQAPPSDAPIRLRHALDFTEDDLAANRQGSLSEAQRARYQKMFKHTPRISACIATLMLVLTLGMFGYVLITAELYKIPEALLSYGVVMSIVIGVVVVSTVWGNRSARRLPDSPVLSVEGQVRLAIRQQRSVTTYQIQVGGKSFFVTPEQHKGFWNGGHYRIYYVRYYANMILSAEMLG